MDQRLYHYQYRRPRLSNPTYSSFNVGNSMTFFMNPGQAGGQGRSSYEDSYQHNNSSYHNNQNQNNYPSHNQNQNQYNQSNYRQSPAQTPVQSRQRSQSQLSNYGNNSLAFNQRQIYNKQNSKFNIISLKPKQVQDRIKQYPKLTLEDKDNYYFKKVQMMRQQQQEMNTSRLRNSSMPSHAENVAGKHTFAPEIDKNPSFYQHGRYFTPKMLNHADQVSHIL